MSGCIFCRIIKKEIPARIEQEGKDFLAIHDINPQAPVHILIFPLRHVEKISDLRPGDETLAGGLIGAAKNIAEKNGLADYRLVFNNGAGAGQSVFHIHLHLLAGRTFRWPPG